MSSQAWKQVLALGDAFRGPEVIDSGRYRIYRHDKNRKRVKRVTRTHFYAFSTFFVSARVIAYFQSFPSPRTHSRVPTHVFKPDCSFSTHFQLLSTIFSCFFKNILSVLIYSLFILSIFDRLYLFSTIFTQIRVLLLVFTYFFKYYFQLFSYIFHYTRQKLELFYTLVILSDRVGLGQVGPTHLTWPLTLCVLGQGTKNLAWTWPF